jgi:putative membrane protein
MWHYHDSWSVGDYVGMGVGMLLFLALVVLVVIAVLRSFPQHRNESAQRRASDRAEELLAERFARGEIDSDEFQRSRDLLRHGGR